MADIKWNVFIEDFNRREIRVFNIFNHDGFKKDCDKAWEDNCNDSENGFSNFSKNVRNSLLFYFWSKCEYEVLLFGFPYNDKFKAKKIDVFEQVTINWDQFINYLWACYILERYKQADI